MISVPRSTETSIDKGIATERLDIDFLATFESAVDSILCTESKGREDIFVDVRA